jgi:signal transduction histidine kinase
MIDLPQSPSAAMGAHGLRPTLEELCQNTRLLIRLRWAAGFAILAATIFARYVLGIHLQTTPLILIGLAVLAYNSLLCFACRKKDRTMTRAWRVAWGQIILDWLAMTALVHFTGGITSPALIYFAIHGALSGTILPPRYARTLAVLATVIVGGLAWLESSGVLPYVAIPEFELGHNLHDNATYVAAIMFFFGTTMITLSELVAQKAQRLRQREEHIHQLYEARATFVRVATHELRAPVSAGLSLMYNIEQGYAGEFNEQQAAILSRVTSRLEGLRTLIDDLLTLAASREATVAQAPLEPVEVRPVLEKMIGRELPTIEQKQLALQTHFAQEDGTILAGDVGLSVIFGNLLSNAVKYTPAGGSIILDYTVNRHEHKIEISVADSGIGIPADDLPFIFGEFFRAKNAKASSISGTGIGLSTVRTLVERYRGTISVESEEGRGTTFKVVLPLA